MVERRVQGFGAKAWGKFADVPGSSGLGTFRDQSFTGLTIPGDGVLGVLAFAPVSDEALDLRVNGVQQTLGVDYIMAGSTIIWQAASSPTTISIVPGDVIDVTYVTP